MKKIILIITILCAICLAKQIVVVDVNDNPVDINDVDVNDVNDIFVEITDISIIGKKTITTKRIVVLVKEYKIAIRDRDNKQDDINRDIIELARRQVRVEELLALIKAVEKKAKQDD